MSGADRVLLAIDTATSRAVAALGDPRGILLEEVGWEAGYRHGEELLSRIVELLDAAQRQRQLLAGVIVGTGPGAFTGLRIGLATAKTLAHELRLPIVGVSSALALAHAAVERGARPPIAVLLPAGPSGLVVADVTWAAPGGELSDAGARLVNGSDTDVRAGSTAVAVDLDGRTDPVAGRLGQEARSGLAASLVALGAARLARGEHDDVAELVPEYVSLPRGVTAAAGEVAWSLDPR